MASRYWVGGTAAWDGTAGSKWATTSGGAGGAAIPSAADDVFLDAASGAVTVSLSGSRVCRSLNCTGFTGTLAQGNNPLTIGDGTAGASNIALKLVAGMTYTVVAAGVIALASTSATQQTIATGGKTMGALSTTASLGASYLLADAWSGTGSASFINGTLDTGNFNFTASTLTRTTAGTFTLTPGSSVLTFTSGGAAINNNTPVNFTVTSNTATIHATNAPTGLALSTTNYNGASLTINMGSVTSPLTGAPTGLKDLLITGGGSKTGVLTFEQSVTFSGSFTVNGNSAINRPLISSAVPGTTVTLSAATALLSNVDFEDITGAGAATWAGTSIGDCQGNSGIMFTTPTTRYAVGTGTRNSDDSAIWSATSGGSGGASVPLAQDTVILNSNSGTGTFSFNMPRSGASLDTTGFGGNFRVSTVACRFFGDFTWGSSMNASPANSASGLIQLSGRGAHTITSNGVSWSAGSSTGNFMIAAVTGSYTLTDDFSINMGTLVWISGGFSTANHNMNLSVLSSIGSLARTIDLGTSTITLASTWNISSATNLTMNAASSTIVYTALSTARTFQGGGQTYGTLDYSVAGSTGSLTINGSNYFDTLNFSDASNARSLLLTSHSSQTVKTFNIQGTSDNLVILSSVTAGTAAYINLIGPLVSKNYLSIKDIYSGIPYKFYAENSTDVSGNAQILFTAPPVNSPYVYEAVSTHLGGATSITSSLRTAIPVGSIILCGYGSALSPGTVTAPSGFVLIDSNSTSTTSANLMTYYKIADGTESDLTFTNTISRTIGLRVMVLAGFNGTPVIDVLDKNANQSGVTSLSTTTSTGPANTANPAFAAAFFAGSASLGSTVSSSNGFHIHRPVLTEDLFNRSAGKLLTSTGAVDTTYTWSTPRAMAAQLVVVKSVSTSTGNFFLMF